MQKKLCSHCGSSDVQTKQIEIRHINSHTMALASKQKVTELECKACGWIIALEPATACR